ncbi:MAG TPA: endonuclease domain-containing protein [Bacillota bacterium]
MHRPLYNEKTLKSRKLMTNGYSLPYNPDLVPRAVEMRNNMTPAEFKLWTGFLTNFDFKVYRQRPIDNFIVDFYCSKLNLVIEIDGSVHDSLEAKVSDQERTEILQNYGLKVLRFSNNQVEEDFEWVCQKIKEQIPNPLRCLYPSPLK